MIWITIILLAIVHVIIAERLRRKLRRAEKLIFDLRGDAKHNFKLAGGLEAQLEETTAQLEEAKAKLAKFDYRSRKRGPNGKFLDDDVEGVPV